MTLPAITSAAVWAPPPNWQSHVTIRYEFKTDIVSSRSNREQRRSLRNTARKSIYYMTQGGGDEFRALNLFLRANQDATVATPEWSRYAQTTASVSTLGDTLTFTATPTWTTVGRAVMLLNGSTVHVAEITAVTGTTVTIDPAVTVGWSSGTKVYAALLSLIGNPIASKRLTNAVTKMPVSFSVFPGAEPVESGGAAVTTFNGREVFTQRANWGEDVSVDHIWQTETVDFGRGRIEDFRPIGFPSQVRKAVYLQRDTTEAQAIVDFFRRQKGRRGAFYLPSYDDDLKLEATASSGGNTLTVSAGSATSLLAADAGGYDGAQEAICVRLGDGTMLYRLVQSVATAGANRVLTCSGTWPVALSTANVRGVSWMPLCRFASDILEMTWLSDAVAQTQISFQSLMTEDAT